MNKKDLVDVIFQKSKLTKLESKELATEILETMKFNLEQGVGIHFTNVFSLNSKEYAARKIQTSKRTVEVPAKTRYKLYVPKEIINTLNGL